MDSSLMVVAMILNRIEINALSLTITCSPCFQVFQPRICRWACVKYNCLYLRLRSLWWAVGSSWILPHILRYVSVNPVHARWTLLHMQHRLPNSFAYAIMSARMERVHSCICIIVSATVQNGPCKKRPLHWSTWHELRSERFAITSRVVDKYAKDLKYKKK